MDSGQDSVRPSPMLVLPDQGTDTGQADGTLPLISPGLPSASKPRPHRNLKKLSLTIPATPVTSGPATASFLPIEKTNKFAAPPKPVLSLHPPTRRASIVSLPPVSSTALYRKDEAESPSVPYRDGPIQVIPHLWIGDEDSARDWKGLRERGIKSILNVAKELPCPLQHQPNPLRGAQSTSTIEVGQKSLHTGTYYPPHLPSGRPAFHYLKLPWSHGQTNLVKDGFPAAMHFVDGAMERGEGVLVHCQCGVSRSATLVIALVMRAASCAGFTTPPDIGALKGGGMHAAYAFVKEKSKWIGPNMSLIYQLLDYERTLQSGNGSPNSSIMLHDNEDEVEWGRQRRALEEVPVHDALLENPVFAHEAKALDQEMEERKIARKSSQVSVASSSSGLAAAPIWRSRYGFPGLGRNRAGSIGSNRSNFSEDILEEGEEDIRFSSGASPSTLATDEDAHGWPMEAVDNDHTIILGAPAPKVPVSMPATPSHKSPFNSVSRTRMKGKAKHRPPPLVNLLPPVPSSPLPAAIPIHEPVAQSISQSTSPNHSALSSLRSSTRDRRRLSRSSVSSRSSVHSTTSAWSSSLQTPSQTLLVFPSEDVGGISTVMLTATPAASSFPSLPSRMPNLTARKPCLKLGTVSTPTTAFSFVEVQGTNATIQALKRQA